MALVTDADDDALKDYHAAAAKGRYPLTTRGDADLCPASDEALIRASIRGQADDDTVDPRQDAEDIAEHILSLYLTGATQFPQRKVKDKLLVSRQTNQQLASQGLNRDNVTAELQQAIAAYNEAVRMERRAAEALMKVGIY